MCLAVPVEVVKIKSSFEATVNFGGVQKEINIMLVDGLKPGDFVVVHNGFALNKLDPEEAQKTLDAIKEVLHRYQNESEVGGVL